MHTILPTECYIYSYCVGGSGICMHADIMLLYLLLYLWIMISTKKESWEKLLSISLLFSLGVIMA